MRLDCTNLGRCAIAICIAAGVAAGTRERIEPAAPAAAATLASATSSVPVSTAIGTPASFNPQGWTTYTVILQGNADVHGQLVRLTFKKVGATEPKYLLDGLPGHLCALYGQNTVSVRLLSKNLTGSVEVCAQSLDPDNEYKPIGNEECQTLTITSN